MDWKDLMFIFDMVYIWGVFEEGIFVVDAGLVDAEGVDTVLVNHLFVHFGGNFIDL